MRLSKDEIAAEVADNELLMFDIKKHEQRRVRGWRTYQHAVLRAMRAEFGRRVVQGYPQRVADVGFGIIRPSDLVGRLAEISKWFDICKPFSIDTRDKSVADSSILMAWRLNDKVRETGRGIIIPPELVFNMPGLYDRVLENRASGRLAARPVRMKEFRLAMDRRKVLGRSRRAHYVRLQENDVGQHLQVICYSRNCNLSNKLIKFLAGVTPEVQRVILAASKPVAGRKLRTGDIEWGVVKRELDSWKANPARKILWCVCERQDQVLAELGLTLQECVKDIFGDHLTADICWLDEPLGERVNAVYRNQNDCIIIPSRGLANVNILPIHKSGNTPPQGVVDDIFKCPSSLMPRREYSHLPLQFGASNSLAAAQNQLLADTVYPDLVGSLDGHPFRVPQFWKRLAFMRLVLAPNGTDRAMFDHIPGNVKPRDMLAGVLALLLATRSRLISGDFKSSSRIGPLETSNVTILGAQHSLKATRALVLFESGFLSLTQPVVFTITEFGAAIKIGRFTFLESGAVGELVSPHFKTKYLIDK